MIALLFASSVFATVASSRADIEAYLQSVYAMSNFSSLSDKDLYSFFDSLTFYYQNHPFTPTWPNRKQSHPYAGTVCDCLHINLTMCQTRPSSCPFWPVESYLTLQWDLAHTMPGFPSNVWFEGLTFPGEWGFPLSCQNRTLGKGVYAWHRFVWLYPITGSGVWFNSGNTAAAYNKPHWLLKYGQNAGIGTTPAQIMDSMAQMTCTNYRQLSSCNSTCADGTQDDPTYCCCHGRNGANLAMQVVAVKQQNGLTWDAALTAVAQMYSNGQTGNQDYSGTYPNGTYFGYIDTLDPTIKSIQTSSQYDTIQFLREPQHGGFHSDPVYAFEIGFHAPFGGNPYYRWVDFCNAQQKVIAVLDPLSNVQSYKRNGYIQVGSGVSTRSIDAFVARPEFAALFQSDQ